MGRYLILGACNPGLAQRAWRPSRSWARCCPATWWSTRTARPAGRRWWLVVQDPQPMLGAVGNPALAPVAAEARQRLERALATLGGRPR